MNYIEQKNRYFDLELARKKKPSGRKDERKRGKLPNQMRHDQNASIAVGTWGKKRERKSENTN